MRQDSIQSMLNECSAKYFGSAGSREAPRAVPTGEKLVKPFISHLSSINTDVRHASYGSRTPIISGVDPLGDAARGDHGALSALFNSNDVLRAIANNTQDIANQNVGGRYEAISKRSNKGELGSSLVFSQVTPGGSVQETNGYWRHSGNENGSAYFSISFLHKTLDRKEWSKIKKLIEMIFSSKNERLSVRGAFLDFDRQRVPTAFSIKNEDGKNTSAEMCDHNEKNNRQVKLDELMANLEKNFTSSGATNFYLAGTFDI